MIGRKLVVLSNGNTRVFDTEEISGVPFIEDLKEKTTKNIKKYGYVGLVGLMRGYFRSKNFLKIKYQEVKEKTMAFKNKKTENISSEKKEASKFLKMVTDYKYKIRRIKEDIENEEGL